MNLDVKTHMEYMRETLSKAMKMTNCNCLKDVTRDILN
jgi:isopentenyl diphosphate isomerase/L-lactate dehydrogenase-like FMN-dependent dehydrogenase